jgi:hypothetical protein
MLDGQTFYGQKLKVFMINCPDDTIILPKGLTNVGLGLGTKGKPLRDVVKHYKKFMKHQKSDLDLTLFGQSDDVVEENDKTKETLLESAIEEIVDETSRDSGQNDEARPFKVISVEDFDEDLSENSSKKAKIFSHDTTLTIESNSNVEKEDVNNKDIRVNTGKLLVALSPSSVPRNIPPRPYLGPIGAMVPVAPSIRPSAPILPGPSGNIAALDMSRAVAIGPPGVTIISGPPVPTLPRAMNPGFPNMNMHPANINMGPTRPPIGAFGSVRPQMMPSHLGPRPEMVPVAPVAHMPSLELVTMLFRNVSRSFFVSHYKIL